MGFGVITLNRVSTWIGSYEKKIFRHSVQLRSNKFWILLPIVWLNCKLGQLNQVGLGFWKILWSFWILIKNLIQIQIWIFICRNEIDLNLLFQNPVDLIKRLLILSFFNQFLSILNLLINNWSNFIENRSNLIEKRLIQKNFIIGFWIGRISLFNLDCLKSEALKIRFVTPNHLSLLNW